MRYLVAWGHQRIMKSFGIHLWSISQKKMKKYNRTNMCENYGGCYSYIVDDSLQWRYDERDGVINHRHLNCLLNLMFRRRSKKTSNLRVTDLCEGNPPVTGEFPSQRASNAEHVSIWWRHHVHWEFCRQPPMLPERIESKSTETTLSFAH